MARLVRSPFGYFMLQLSSSTNVLPDIHHLTTRSVIEAANVEDVARIILAASLSSSGAADVAVLAVEERTLVVVANPSPSPRHPDDRQRVHGDVHSEFSGQLIKPIDDSMRNTRVTFLGGKEGKWSSTK